MDDGYITLSRRFFASEKWQAARAFSEAEAWLDLIQSARFEASSTTSRIGCYEVTWNRGQYPASNRYLAKKWGRSEQWVKSFLRRLKRDDMITTDNSQGVTVITLKNYDKYNYQKAQSQNMASNPPDNTPNNPLNNLTDSELQALVTHLITHLITHPEILQLTSNPNNNKDNNNIITTTTTNAYVCEEAETGTVDFELTVYPKYIKSLKKSKGWLETLAMNYHLTIESLKKYLDDFESDCMCRGFDDKNKTLRDCMSHFNNWLMIRMRLENERKDNGNRQSNGAPTTKAARRNEAAGLVAKILARDNP